MVDVINLKVTKIGARVAVPTAPGSGVSLVDA
jgi:hypothetical protein